MKTDWKECEESNWHCAANVFPLLERDELEALAEDIKAHGLLNPIIRCDGKVLDGRNRALACRLVQVEPRFRDIPLEDALIWARSQNCLRRHLKPTEDALALLLMEIQSGEKHDNSKGKNRERAYKKLARLKTWLAEWAEGIPSDCAEQLKDKLRIPKKEVSKFEELFRKLNALVPTYSDGAEHKFVTLVEDVCSSSKEEMNPVDKEHLRSIVRLLTEVSKGFAAYAERLSG